MSVSAFSGRALRLAVAATLALTSALVLSDSAGAHPAGSKPAIYNSPVWYLRSSLTSGVATSTFTYGRSGDLPVMGDWDGDGHDTVGVVRFSGAGGISTYTWYLRNSNSAGSATITPFVFGNVRFVAIDQLGTIPVVGDWDGDGIDTIGVMVYDFDLDGPIRWLLRNSNSTGPPDIVINYGRGRDTPLAGDWNGDGTDTVGVFRRPKSWLLRNSNTSGTANLSFAYGSGDFLELPVPGDWDGNGTYTPTILRNNPPSDEFGGFEVWLFRNSNSSGVADGKIIYGSDAFAVDLPIDFIPRLSWR
jgi:hypothetical protein